MKKQKSHPKKIEKKELTTASQEAKELFQLAFQFHNNDRLHESLIIYKYLYSILPNDFDIVHLYGTNLYQLGNNDLALIILERGISLNSEIAEIYSNLGNVYKNIGNYEKSIICYKKALKLKPELSDAQVNLGGSLFDTGKFEDAEKYCKQAIDLGCNRPEVWNNYGLLRKHYDPFEALNYFRKAVELSPSFYDGWWNLSLVELMCGDYINGWEHYENRYQGQTPAIPFHGINLPSWNGQDLTGKTILVHSEQGFGDSIQFCRYLPLLKSQYNASQVIFMVQSPLVKLMQYSFPGIHVMEIATTVPQFDFHAPLMSLPRGFKTTVETIPNSLAGLNIYIPYLKIDKKTAQEKFPTTPSSGLKIGIFWAGGRRQQAKVAEVDKRRSMTLEMFNSLFDLPGINWISLQKDDAAKQLTLDYPINGDLIQECHDFYDTACLISRLNLVIGVDSALIHLASAMGIKTIVLNRWDQCWRWLWNRADSPYYPGVIKLFKQVSPGDWAPVVLQVRNLLEKG